VTLPRTNVIRVVARTTVSGRPPHELPPVFLNVRPDSADEDGDGLPNGFETRYSAFNGNIRLNPLDRADAALGSITDSLRRAYELSMQVGSDTYSEVNRQQTALEVDGLFKQVVAQLNTKVGNRFIFGGTQDDAPAYLDDGTDMGDDGEHRVEVAPGLTETVSVGMNKLMNDPQGVDVLGTLKSVSDAMKAGDGNAIRSLAGTLTKSIDQVLSGRVKAGATTNLLEMATTASQTLQDAATKNKSALVDTDYIEAASRLALSQHALDAAMAASTKSFELTLLSRFK
jgi:flagellar hook-associated protein 3 FlgL